MGIKSCYNQVKGATIRRLIDISGPKAVLNDAGAREKYSLDETIGLSHPPEVVVLPANQDEIKEILKLAKSENIRS